MMSNRICCGRKCITENRAKFKHYSYFTTASEVIEYGHGALKYRVALRYFNIKKLRPFFMITLSVFLYRNLNFTINYAREAEYLNLTSDTFSLEVFPETIS